VSSGVFIQCNYLIPALRFVLARSRETWRDSLILVSDLWRCLRRSRRSPYLCFWSSYKPIGRFLALSLPTFFFFFFGQFYLSAESNDDTLLNDDCGCNLILIYISPCLGGAEHTGGAEHLRHCLLRCNSHAILSCSFLLTMFLKLPASLLAFVLLGDFSCALRLNFEGRRIPLDRRGLQRRGSLAGSSPLDDSADLQYTTNITIGGASFDVLIDTGR
jgi:hypothetical protein